MITNAALSVSRRSLLTGAIALGVAQLLTGCQTASDQHLMVTFLRDAIPPPMLGEFRRVLEHRVNLDFSAEPQLEDLFEALVRWQHQEDDESENGSGWRPWGRSPQIPELTLLGHSWLPRAIEGGLLQPLDSQAWDNWGISHKPRFLGGTWLVRAIAFGGLPIAGEPPSLSIARIALTV